MRVLLVILAFIFTQSLIADTEKMPHDILKDPVFVSLGRGAQLAKLNDLFNDKKLKANTKISAFIGRLLWQEIGAKGTIEDKLAHYGSLRGTYNKLPSNFALERTLAVEFLAQAIVAKNKDLLTQLRELKNLEDSKKLSWPALNSLYTGLLAAHLAGNEIFGKADLEAKIDYLRKLETDGIIKPLTSSDFLKGYAVAYLAGLSDEDRKSKLKSVKEQAGFFAKGVIDASFNAD